MNYALNKLKNLERVAKKEKILNSFSYVDIRFIECNNH